MRRFDIPIGSVIATNNINPDLNGKFGRFNHVAIVVSSSNIIESLEGTGVVVNTIEGLIYGQTTGEYTLLIPKNIELGIKAADIAYSLAGTKYNLWSTLTRWSARRKYDGLSCIGTVRYAFEKATGYTLHWRYPDDVLTSNLFQQTEIYRNV